MARAIAVAARAGEAQLCAISHPWKPSSNVAGRHMRVARVRRPVAERNVMAVGYYHVAVSVVDFTPPSASRDNAFAHLVDATGATNEWPSSTTAASPPAAAGPARVWRREPVPMAVR